MSKTSTHQKFSIGYKQTNLGPLPNTWEAVLLGDLFVFKNGLNKAKRFFGSGTPIVNYMDVFERLGLRPDDLSGRVSLTPEEIRNFEVQRGDVFFTRTSETVEEIGVASVMLYEPHDTVFSGFVLRARPRDRRLNDHYKQYCFAHRVVRSQIISNATYTTRALTNGRTLSTVWIAVPPTPEQRAIAEALSDVDGLINALEALIAKKRAIKQAVMQQLLTGKTRLPGFSRAWETKRLGEITEIKKGSLITEKDVVSGTIPVIAGGQKPAYYHNTANRTGKTITVSASGAYAGFVTLHVEPIFASDCSTVSESSSFSIDFIYYYLVFNQNVIYNAQTGGAQPHIHPVDLMPLQVDLPPLPEQQAIASVLSDIDTEIAASAQRRDKTRAIKQGMMQQLLTGRVRLVKPQHRTETSTCGKKYPNLS